MSNATPVFIDYNETTVDPGWSFIMATAVACLLLNLSLPCLVSLGSRYERRRNQETSHRNKSNNHNSTPSAEERSDGDGRSSTLASRGPENILILDLNRVGTSEGIGVQREDANTRKSPPGEHHQQEQQQEQRQQHKNQQRQHPERQCQRENEILGLVAGQSDSNNIRYFMEKEAPPPPQDKLLFGGIQKTRSDASLTTGTVFSSTTFAMTTTAMDWFCGMADAFILPSYPDQSTPRRAEGCTFRPFLPDSGDSIASHDSSFLSLVSTSIFGGRPNNRSRRTNGRTAGVDRVDNSSIYSENISWRGEVHDDSINSIPNRRFGAGDLGSAYGGDASGSAPTPNTKSHGGSVMSPLNPDDVSFNEAIDSYGEDQAQYQLPNDVGTGEVDLLCGEHAWWKPSMIVAGFDRIVGVAEWDDELMRILKLAFPLSLQSLLSGILAILDVALVGYMYGTNEANAFIVISLLTELTNTINYGFFETLGNVLPFVIGTENEGLAGKYLDTSLILYTVGSIPLILLWSSMAKPIVLWFGFDEETAELAMNFAFAQVVLEYMSGFGYCMQLLLDLTGHELFGSLSTLVFTMSQSMGVIMPIFIGQKTLGSIGIWRLGLSMTTLSLSIVFISLKGWLSAFREGLLTGWLPNWGVVKETVKTSIPLGVSYFLTYGEWKLLLICARTLGPAEVVAWGLLGYVWAALGYVSDGLADAAELQCAFHLGTNNPELARLSAYKSVYLGLVSACFATSVVFLIGEDLVRWITPDPMLERLVIELLPLVGIGQVVMSASSIAWALVGAQGRSRLATTIHFVGSWGVSTPLSILLTYTLNINLQGLLAALVLGLTLAGTGNMYILIRSQWGRLAKLAAADYDTDDTSHSPEESTPPTMETTRAGKFLNPEVPASQLPRNLTGLDTRSRTQASF